MDPEITVSTIVKTHEDITLVGKAIRSLFPDWDCEISGVEDTFPVTREEIELSGKSQSLSGIIQYCSNNRILDTAFDVMTMNLQKDATQFQLSRPVSYTHLTLPTICSV